MGRVLRGSLAVVAALAVAGIAAASPTAVPKKLVGTYEAYLGIGPGARDPGRWELAIGPRGAAYVVVPLGYSLAPGRVSGNTIVFPGEGRNAACSAKGTYRYKLTGDILRLTRVNDACRARIFRLSAGTWKRFSDYFPVVIIRR